jgi:predicted metal-binding membrane protein
MFLQPRRTDSRPFLAVLIALIAVAWLALLLWGRSPYGRYLGHGNLDQVTLAGSSLPLILAFVAGWTLMIVAMMLPTTLPLLLLFRDLVRRRSDRTWLLSLVIAGYLVIWGLFGVIVHVWDWLVHLGVNQWGWLSTHAWVLGSLTLLVAGIYQFTPLKYHCLDKCRSPFSFVTEHWRGRREGLYSFRLGVSHGIFCVGCCWSLMLLMFAVGVGNLGWMFVLAAVMAIEKNVSWGRRLSTPLGLVLLGTGLAIAMQATLL